ncbi:MAG TPA: hypothetical protein VGR35_07810 [Tepidisphaeraceae bacterium]|nr:hypothetical protein [Tepidisphaeraceae bacterium]
MPSPPATSDPTPSTDQAQIQPTQSPATAPDAPLRRQVLEATEKLHARRFSGLLHFETKADAIFVAAEPSKPHVKRGEAHTGNSMLLLAPGTRRLTVKLSSLLTGREFPGEWTLLGLYVRPDEPTSATLSCKVDGRVIAARNVSLPGGDWSPAMLDLAALPNPVPPGREATLELRLDQPATGNVRIDDVLLINNRQTLVDAGPEGWTVKRAGLRVICERKQRFNLGVVTRDGSPQGWEVEEANELRARFSSSGETTALTVYADGRSFWDGVYQPLSADVRDDKTFAAAHAAPAEIALPETMGRIDRSTQGDMNNDGYNEQLGAYQLQASGGRLELTISPRGAPVPRPVLQIAGMPEGKALITIEGKLVERSTRLPEGQLLVELPARITRATLVTIRIQ